MYGNHPWDATRLNNSLDQTPAMAAKDFILDDPSALARDLATDLRVLGVDLGDKTIGLAISDPNLRVASPITTLKRAKMASNAREIADIMASRGAAGLVIGLPINMDGTEGPRAQATRDWSLELARRIEKPIAFWDERMSTMAVERMMLEADMTRKRRAEKVDQAAAAYILQAALDAIR
jgi:putative holliday junction resolvase